MRISNRGGRGVLPLFLLLSFMAFNLYAGGDGDPSATFDPKTKLANAEKLFDEKLLDKAMKAAVEIARTDPEQMERVQKLILKIQEIKNLINDLLAEAFAAAAAGNFTRLDEIIKEIETLDKEPNPDLLQKLILLKRTIDKSTNDGIRDGFFERGNLMLASEDYSDAVSEYRRGFFGDKNVPGQSYTELYSDYIQRALGQTDFIVYDNSPDREAKVALAYSTIGLEGEAVIEGLNSALDDWKNNNEQMPAAAESLSALISTSPVSGWAAAAAGLERNLSTALEDVARVRKLTADLDFIWTRLVSALDDTPEDFHYKRIGQFLNGRIGENHNGTVVAEQEGILLAMELQWETSFLSAADAMNARISGILTGARSDYLAKNWNATGSGFGSASSASDELLGFLEISDAYLLSEPGETTRFSERTEVLSAYGEYVSAASKIWTELVALGRTLAVSGAGSIQNITIDTIDTQSNLVQATVDRVSVLTGDWNAAESKLALLPGAKAAVVREVDAALRSDLLDLYIKVIEPLYAFLEKNAADAAAVNLDQIRGLINHDPVLQEGEIPVRRPIFALNSLIVPALSKLNSVEKSLVDFDNVLDELLNRRPPLANPEEIQKYKKNAQGLLLSTAALRDDLLKEERDATGFANAARNADTTAKIVLDKVLVNLNSATAAVAIGERNDDIDEFNRAVDLYNAVDGDLDYVDKLYKEVLVNDTDFARTSGLDDRRNALRVRNQKERIQVAESVKRNAITEGRSAYEEARYREGEILLTQAQEFWRRTFDEEDKEIGGWLTRVRNALRAREKTVILPEDPLFPEMNQYLNLANRYYMEGMRIKAVSPGSADILRNFSAARDLLTQVLLIFPGNKAAQLLNSRILWETDAEKAGSEAAELVQRARTALRSCDPDDPEDQKKAVAILTELYVLKEIRPVYLGIDNLILGARICAGEIPPPTPEQDIEESKRLTREARVEWDKVKDDAPELNPIQQAQADRAIKLLNDAIVLWLDNQEAIKLRVEIRRKLIPPAPLPEDVKADVKRFNDAYDEQDYTLCRILVDNIVKQYGYLRTHPEIIKLYNRLGDAGK